MKQPGLWVLDGVRIGPTSRHGVHPEAFRCRSQGEVLRDRFDRGLRAIDSGEVMAGLDRFHRQAAEIPRSDRVRAALDLSREPDAPRDDQGRTALGRGRRRRDA